MNEGKIFQFALVVSILAHSAFFWSVPNLPFTPSRKSLQKLDITYYEIKKIIEKKEPEKKEAESIIKKLPEIKKEDILVPPPRSAAKEPETPVTEKAKDTAKEAVAVKKIEQKKFEKVVEEEKDASKKAAYISYYKAVRERIKQHADDNYPRIRNFGEGEVYLSFVVASSGELLMVKVVDERSAKNAALRDIAINSLRDASPFPPFPQGMNQYQITFNIIISFETNR